MKSIGASRFIWALVWAIAIIGSAFLFKGNPSFNWIEPGLVGLALVFVVLKPLGAGCVR